MEPSQVEVQSFEHVRAASQHRAESKAVFVVVVGLMCFSLVLVWQAGPAELGGAARNAGKSLGFSNLGSVGVGRQKSRDGWNAAAAKDPMVQFQSVPLVHNLRGPRQMPASQRAPSVRAAGGSARAQSTRMSGVADGWDYVRGPSPPMIPGGDDERWTALGRVWVLLYNPRTENEGIYTLQLPFGVSNINTVILFEEQADAERYAGLLEAQDFPRAEVEALEPSDIAKFANEQGHKISFIPAGTLFIPPEESVEPLERPWQRHGVQSGEKTLEEILADADDHEQVDYDTERARLEALFGKG